MIKIWIPDNFVSERKYIISILFNEFLGLEYQIRVLDGKDYRIILENENKLIIEDSFFSKLKDDKYLSKENLPSQLLQRANNQFTIDDDLPIIYGNENTKIAKDTIICGIDIFAGSFFMLSRWEEYVNKTRDLHNRFPVAASLAYKNNFLNRPVINEYLEMLWNMLIFLGIKQDRKKRNFEVILTHDVDDPLKWFNFAHFIKNLGGDIIKRKSFSLALNNLKKYVLHNDPYNTFDYLMGLSEKIGVKSHFFFMAGGVTKFDTKYSLKAKFIKKLMDEIGRRDHIIGFHPSYYSYSNPQLWKEEYEKLCEVSSQPIKFGRQHYLRFEVPTTWQIWGDMSMDWDSTLSYADREGFRCGTGDEFPVFNILTRKKLSLKERPLIIMEGILQHPQYLGLSPAEALKIFNYYVKISKKYKSKLVLLWHNSSFNTPEWNEYAQVYESALEELE